MDVDPLEEIVDLEARYLISLYSGACADIPDSTLKGTRMALNMGNYTVYLKVDN